MTLVNPYDKYKQTQVETASQGTLIIMLYEAALRNLNIARESLENKRLNQAHNALVKAQEIVMELNLGLNMEAGPIAENLRKLYSFMYDHLVEANVKKEIKPVDDVIGLLTELKEAWDSIIRKKTVSPAGGIKSGL